MIISCIINIKFDDKIKSRKTETVLLPKYYPTRMIDV